MKLLPMSTGTGMTMAITITPFRACRTGNITATGTNTKPLPMLTHTGLTLITDTNTKKIEELRDCRL